MVVQLLAPAHTNNPHEDTGHAHLRYNAMKSVGEIVRNHVL